MSINKERAYDMDGYVAEVYDQIETQMDDVALIRKLVEGKNCLRILEPFCGTGRIAIPLAEDGHRVIGLERSTAMLKRLRDKMTASSENISERIKLHQMDVLSLPWPENVDLVLLGGNCFYELATPEEQENCIAKANEVIVSGGYVYIDNNHMEGELDAEWRREPGQPRKAFPSGTCSDGTLVEGTTETLRYDVAKRTVCYHRTVTVIPVKGEPLKKEWQEQCHPPSKDEVTNWLEGHGFVIEQLYGDRLANPYDVDSPRAIFWARKI